MAELTFKDLSFKEEETKVRISFLNIFYTEVDASLLEKIGHFKVENNRIQFQGISDVKARRKFQYILERSFPYLKNKMTHKPAYYIHQNSGIPLMGTNYFGLIDRGTNVIEVKPLTSCNISCIFCSVDEGPTSRRKVDYVVEKDYLVEEFKKVAALKNIDDLDAHINAQGEPTLYADLPELVKEIMRVKGVVMSSIDTNGLLLSKPIIDKLAEAGLKRVNLSLHALDQKIANKMAGFPYNVKKVTELCPYITKKMDLVITPVWLPGINDEELPKLAKFAEKVGAGKECPPIGIQNFMPYQFGRNPIKEASFDHFFKRMKELEEKHNVSLLQTKGFGIHPVKEIPKPFKKNQIVEAEIKMPGRIGSEKIAVAKDRCISIPQCKKEKGFVKVKIKRTKHNVFLGELLS